MGLLATLLFGTLIFSFLYGVVIVWDQYIDGYYKEFGSWKHRLFNMVFDIFTPLGQVFYYAWYACCLLLVMSFFLGWPVQFFG